MINNFYNTIGEAGELLGGSRRKVNDQNTLILQYFLNHPKTELTPFEVQDLIPALQKAPITSIRRGMTNLANDGFLIKTDTKRLERLGKTNFCWKLSAYYMEK